MSKDDYARLFVQAPTRLLLMAAIAFGSGAGWHLVSWPDDRVESAQRDLAVCQYALADYRSIAAQHERDIAELSDWAAGTISTLGSLQRVEALRRAPAAYSFARGAEVSR